MPSLHHVYLALQLIATFAVAAFAADIAWQQKEIARAKLEHDLFEERLEIYKKVKERLRTALLFQETIIVDILSDTAGTSFLFGDDVVSYLNSLNLAELSLSFLEFNRDKVKSEEYREFALEHLKQVAEVKKLYDKLDSVFGNYLKPKVSKSLLYNLTKMVRYNSLWPFAGSPTSPTTPPCARRPADPPRP